MKYLNYFLLVICLFSACKAPSTQTSAQFHSEILKYYAHTDSGIIISCFNCSCIVDFLKTYYSRHQSPELLIDTTCSNLKINKNITYANLPQKILDSIYERNYNAILFKNLYSKKGFVFKILKTEDYKNYERIVNKFFNNK